MRNASPDGHVLQRKGGVFLRCPFVTKIRTLKCSIHVCIANNTIQALLIVESDEQLCSCQACIAIWTQVIKLCLKLLDQADAVVRHLNDVLWRRAEGA